MDHFILADLDDKLAQQAELRKKLDGSLSIQAFMPDAFKHGPVKVGGRSTEQAPHKGVITFTLGNGDVREMPAMKVPYKVWPQGLKDALANMRDRRLAQRIMKELGASYAR